MKKTGNGERTRDARIGPTRGLLVTDILDATPAIVSRYVLNDEDDLLARIRYNRLMDVFTGLGCHALQSHLRTTLPGIGEVETHEIYVGIDRKGERYVLPVAAKGRMGRIGTAQVEQNIAVCRAKFPNLRCLPIAAKLMATDVIVLFLFERTQSGLGILSEKHYRPFVPLELSLEDLIAHQNRPVRGETLP